MPITFNLRHVENKNLRLQGDLPAGDLDLETNDEMLQVREGLRYDLEVQRLDDAILVQGTLALTLDCQCVRCLKAFRHPMRLEGWVCHLALEGEEKVAVSNDCVDLTPHLREDIFLAFPQHPLCKPDCRGLARLQSNREAGATITPEPDPAGSPWTALDKLKL